MDICILVVVGEENVMEWMIWCYYVDLWVWECLLLVGASLELKLVQMREEKPQEMHQDPRHG